MLSTYQQNWMDYLAVSCFSFVGSRIYKFEFWRPHHPIHEWEKWRKPIRTKVKSTRKRVMSPIIRPREICSGPSTSKAGMRYVVRAILITLATANSTSDTISGSSGFQSNRAVKKKCQNYKTSTKVLFENSFFLSAFHKAEHQKIHLEALVNKQWKGLTGSRKVGRGDVQFVLHVQVIRVVSTHESPAGPLSRLEVPVALLDPVVDQEP